MKLAAITSSLLLFACATHDNDMDASDDTTDPTPSPDPQPQPPKAKANGTYDVHSTFDLTIEALLPEVVYAKVQMLRAFSQNPALTMFDAAEDAGVPAVAEVRDALPSYLEDKLEGWINAEIAKVTVDGVPVAQLAGNIAALAERSLGKFSIDSTLTVNTTTATHALAQLDLTPAGLDAQFPLSFVEAATASCSSTTETFTIGAHDFSIPYGEYVWQALDAKLHVRATVGSAVNCPSIATAVSNKCVLGVCVGHKSQLTSICEAGLDEIVDRVHDEFTAIKLDLVSLDAGTATLSNNADNMSGTWTAQINAGQGLRNAPATFTAAR